MKCLSLTVLSREEVHVFLVVYNNWLRLGKTAVWGLTGNVGGIHQETSGCSSQGIFTLRKVFDPIP